MCSDKSVAYLLAQMERNHAVVFSVEDQHGTEDMIHTAEQHTLH